MRLKAFCFIFCSSFSLLLHRQNPVLMAIIYTKSAGNSRWAKHRRSREIFGGKKSTQGGHYHCELFIAKTCRCRKTGGYFSSSFFLCLPFLRLSSGILCAWLGVAHIRQKLPLQSPIGCFCGEDS